jgi:hypothetical protein
MVMNIHHDLPVVTGLGAAQLDNNPAASFSKIIHSPIAK